MKILFAENHVKFAAIVMQQFLNAHEVVLTPSIAGALALLDSQTFDAALVDFDLDDGEGTALVAAIRDRAMTLPVVAVSSHEDGNAALVRAGADHVCSKMEFAKIASLLSTISQ